MYAVMSLCTFYVVAKVFTGVALLWVQAGVCVNRGFEVVMLQSGVILNFCFNISVLSPSPVQCPRLSCLDVCKWI